jgi:O-antigen biosynthesis protein WbqP
MYLFMAISKRCFDILLGSIALLALFAVLFLVAIAVKLTSSGNLLYWSQRIGKDNTVFLMPKFRTMRSDTPVVATHLLTNPDAYLTPVGKFLRTTSLDELPQLYSILMGHMSFVGPRPALFNQDDLIELRTRAGVHVLTPGLTGWAQVNGRDELPIPDKVALDKVYLQKQSWLFDMQILLRTFVKVVRREGVVH